MASITQFPHSPGAGGLPTAPLVRAAQAPPTTRRHAPSTDFTKPDAWTAALLAPSQLAQLPSFAWLIDKLLPCVGLGLLFGESGTLKTFLLLDMLLSVAAGIPFCGLRTTKSRVVYIALEGQQGIHARLQAWLTEHPDARPAIEENFRVILVPLHLFTAVKEHILPAFIEGVRPFAPAVVAVDTVSRTMDGGNDNENVDMGVVIRACQEIEHQLGVLMMLVHHQAKNASKTKPTPRGASNLPAAADVILHVTRKSARLTMKNVKQKNGAELDDLQFIAKSVSLAGIIGGEEQASLVLLQDGTPAVPPPADDLSPPARCLLRILAAAPPEGLASKDLEERSALSTGTFNAARRSLEQAGLIAKEAGKRGYWRLTADERTADEDEIVNLQKSAA